MCSKVAYKSANVILWHNNAFMFFFLYFWYNCYEVKNVCMVFHTDMSVMKWTMVLELKDEELSVSCNEQNFYLIWFYHMISTENVFQSGLQKKNANVILWHNNAFMDFLYFWNNCYEVKNVLYVFIQIWVLWNRQWFWN